MHISKISFFNVKPRQNFNGNFVEVSRNTYEDPEQRFEVTDVEAVYYPSKNESESDIRRAMAAYNNKSRESGGGRVLDGGVDRYGNPTTTTGWSSSTQYSCTRGERLPY